MTTPDDFPSDPDRTSEMTRLRPISDLDDQSEEAAADTAEAEAAVELDVEAVLAERDNFKDIALRLQADFDNYRKRVAAQSALDMQNATGKIADEIGRAHV